MKGPSAATLYGTSAANGVVVITTKKGRAGSARWSYFAEMGSVQDRNLYQPMYMNWGHAPGATAPTRCQLALQSTPAAQGGTPCITDSLTKYLLLRDPTRTFISDGQTKSYGVNVSGGTEAIRYFIAFDAADETAPIVMPGFEQKRFEDAKVPVRYDWKRPLAQQKLNFRTNLNASMSPKLDVGVSMGFNKSNNRTMPTDAAFEALYYTGMQNYGFVGPGPGKGTTTLEGNPLNEYYQYLPGDVMQEIRKQDLQRFLGSVNLNWRPFSWMQNDATVGMDLASYNLSHLPPERVSDSGFAARRHDYRQSQHAAQLLGEDVEHGELRPAVVDEHEDHGRRRLQQHRAGCPQHEWAHPAAWWQ